MNISDHLEPECMVTKTSDGRCGERYLTASETFQLSQAISLKRIADVLVGDASHLGITDAISVAIETGIRSAA